MQDPIASSKLYIVTRHLKLVTQELYGFICDASFFICMHVHEALSNEMKIAELEIVSVQRHPTYL